MDSMLLIAVIVVAVTVGKPLSYLNCQAIGNVNAFGSTYDFTSSLGNSLDKNGGTLNYNNWIGATKTNCLEMKAIWGLSIALWYDTPRCAKKISKLIQLSILFALSSICSVCLWRRKSSPAPKDIEG